MIVAMHEHPRLREIVSAISARTPASSVSRCVGVERAPQCSRDVPVGEQLELAAQQRLVVRRQRAGARRALPLHERVDRVVEERVRRAVVERREVRRRAEVGEQQEAALEVLREHARRIERPRRASSCATCTNGRQSSFGGGASIAISVALAEARRVRRDAEIAAEARVGRRRRHARTCRVASVDAIQAASSVARARRRRRRVGHRHGAVRRCERIDATARSSRERTARCSASRARAR